MRSIRWGVAVLLAFCGATGARTDTLRPARNADFNHYTLALTWQPGFCGTGEGCAPGQPARPLIGVHGLWASLPDTLRLKGVVDTQWWATGCDWLQPHSDAEPPLSPAQRAAIEAVMPQTRGNLLRHEYDKHVQCFGFDPATFFATEIALRDQVANSGFGTALRAHAGQDVPHATLLAEFAQAFRSARPRALQLQCHPDGQGRALLTQLWITIRSDRLDRFPDPDSLTDSPVVQDNCPDTVRVPDWPRHPPS